MSYTSKFTHLLGECRREMNGAVVGSMRYYGAEYGLNYGVSIPTLRQLADGEGRDYKYAKYLYQQQVREIQLIALWVAEPECITHDELNFWAEGIINSEIAEEASFALFQHIDTVGEWLNSDYDLLIYTALLSISKSRRVDFKTLSDRLLIIAANKTNIIQSAIITLLESYYKDAKSRKDIDNFIARVSQFNGADPIVEEMNWRREIYLDEEVK